MLRAEALWLREAILGLPLGEGARVLNVGAKPLSLQRRGRIIELGVIEPVRQRGWQMSNLDLVAGPGVDLCGDLYDDAFFEHVRAQGFDAAFVFNVLEHVPEPARLAARVAALLPSGGWLLASVPRAYPPHDDPIDTGLRPLPEALSALFPDCRALREALVVDRTLLEEWRAEPLRAAQWLARLSVPWFRPRRWWQRAQFLGYLFRPFSVSCVLLRKEDRA